MMPLNWPAAVIEVKIGDDDLHRIHDHLKTIWTRLGKDEPYWSVLTAPEFRSDAFAANEATFYGSGENDIITIAAFAERNGLDLARYQTCFEFGCGVGRVTKWLASRFGRVVAADISPTHLGIAKDTLTASGMSNVEYVHLQSPQ